MQDKAIAVIRHSLAAANAALDLLESTRVNGDTVGMLQAVEVHTAPVAVEVQATPVPAEATSLSDRVQAELASSQYNLRTVAELCSKFGVTSAVLYDALDDMDEGYVTRTRHSDSAPLVGLDSRN